MPIVGLDDLLLRMTESVYLCASIHRANKFLGFSLLRAADISNLEFFQSNFLQVLYIGPSVLAIVLNSFKILERSISKLFHK